MRAGGIWRAVRAQAKDARLQRDVPSDTFRTKKGAIAFEQNAADFSDRKARRIRDTVVGDSVVLAGFGLWESGEFGESG